MAMFDKNNRTLTALGGLVLGAVALLAVNLFADAAFRSMRLDLTDEGLYTLSDGTRAILNELEEPLTARLYFSANLRERSPRHALHYERVRELLEQYSDLSGGVMRLELLDPEPFSDAEDRAVAAGLKGVPVTTAGDLGYFGLALSNSTDREEVVPFFNLERESFVEYDLTKLVWTVSNPEKRKVGLIAGLPLDGGRANPMMGGGAPQRWIVMDQVREFFDVVSIDEEADAIPDNVDTLMVVHPRDMSAKTAYAVDQFAMRGGKVLAFVDPHAETDRGGAPGGGGGAFAPVLKSWGVAVPSDKIAGDLEAARRVNVDDNGRSVVADYVAWLSLGERNFDPKDVITADIQRIAMATPGAVDKVEGTGMAVTPLILTGAQSMRIDAAKVRFRPDVVDLFRNFIPGGEPLTLAARITGKAKSAFPDGPPKSDDADKKDEKKERPAHLSESAVPIHAVVVADADMLYDRFWVAESDFFGQRVLIPTANNADFVVNALEALGGSGHLIGLRGRGETARPFHLIDDIRRDAERRFRAKEEQLLAKLNAVKGQLDSLQRKGAEGGEAILEAKDKAAIADFRREMVKVRKELRGVQHALRQDIERLEGWLKFWNIAGLPLALGAGLLAMVAARRRARAKAVGRGG